MISVIQQLVFASKDIKRKRFMMILFVLELVFTFMYFSITGYQALNSISRLSYLRNLDKHNIIYYDVSANATQYTEEIHNVLSNSLQQRQAYTVIFKNNTEDYPDYDIIVVMGAFNELFGLDALYSDNKKETVCYVGEKVDIEIGDSISFGEIKESSANVVARIPPTYRYVLANSVREFEKTIVISTNIEKYQENFFPIGFVQSTAFVNPGSNLLTRYQIACENAHFDISPRSLAQYTDNMREVMIEDSSLSAILFLLVLLFVLISILINVIQLVDSNKREYSIHILYGATHRKIFLRTFFFVMYITIPTFLIYYFLLGELLEGIQVPIVVMLIFMIVVTLLVCIVALMNFMNASIREYYERNE